MSEVQLLYFRGCPNIGKLREALLQAKIPFKEIQQDDLEMNHPLRKFSSPTILKNDRIIFGTNSGSEGACSLEIPAVAELKDKLKSSPLRAKAKVLTSTGSFGSILTVLLCPVCKPALAVFLSSIGLGIFIRDSVLRSLLVIFLTLMIGGLVWSYLKVHRNHWPLILGTGLAVGLYLGRYVYFGYLENQLLTYGSIVGLISISIWNLFLKRPASCCSCAGKDVSR